MLEELVSRWGYVAIALGSYVEGEAVLLSAGAMAHAGVFLLPLVVLAAMIGSGAWGQTWFHVGRRAGSALILRRPAWHARAAMVERWLQRWGLWVLLFGRFAVGLGTLLPAMIGASGFPLWRFCLLDGLGALLWASVVASAGFGIGAGLGRIAGHPLDWAQLGTTGVAFALLLWFLTSLYAAKPRRRA